MPTSLERDASSACTVITFCLAASSAANANLTFESSPSDFAAAGGLLLPGVAGAFFLGTSGKTAGSRC